MEHTLLSALKTRTKILRIRRQLYLSQTSFGAVNDLLLCEQVEKPITRIVFGYGMIFKRKESVCHSLCTDNYRRNSDIIASSPSLLRECVRYGNG